MAIWQERTDGYFFPHENLSAAVKAKLEMLGLEDFAKIEDNGTLIPFEKSFTLTDSDAELLNLPPCNPYQLSIRTQGYIGAKDFKFVAEFPNAEKSRISGGLLHVGDNIFRLNAEQFALINLIEDGNRNLSSEGNLLTMGELQKHSVNSKLEGYISTKKIVVPEKLDVDFQESGEVVKVEPVLLESHDGILRPIDSTDFQGAFDKRKRILNSYSSRDGRTQYVFNATLQEGLKQIKSVGTLSKDDAERYKLQPRELFTSTAFDFDYSDRVVGVEKMEVSSYGNFNISGIVWGEGSTMPPPPKNLPPRTVLGLKIKENFEQIDYTKGLAPRQGEFFADVLRENVKLFDYQIFGVWWMSQLWQDGWHGVLVADDMGLGKTLQTLTFIGGLKNFNAVNQPILIVAPTALLENWKAEYKKFLREDVFSEVIPLHGDALKNFYTDELTPNGNKKLSLENLPADSLALTTYETLRAYQFSFAEISWSVIVADEAQKIKNPDAGITKALKAMKYDFAICLSGTPVENSWIDLWSIMDFVQPAHLDAKEIFRAKYIDRLKGENIQELGAEFKKSLEPLILRRMKEDYLSALPKKSIYLCPQEMPSYQSKIYCSVLEKYRRREFRTSFEFLAKLREVSLHPDLSTLSIEKFFELDADEIIKRSARLIKTFELLEQIKIRGEKVLIFVTSRDMQLILKRLLEEKFGLKILPPINGTMNSIKRQRFIDEFKRNVGFNVLILSPEAAGVGFTITEANNVIHLSRTWNPAKENQATDRVYRIGQEKAVNVYLPMTCSKNLHAKTFDENLNALLNYKKILSVKILFPTIETNADAKILADILKPKNDEILETTYWTIEDVDDVVGVAFEKIISDLYNTMENFSAIKTPDSNDFGADVVVQSLTGNTGLLIQCKHTTFPERAIGSDGVKEIYAAVAHYEKQYRLKFQPVVITNAKDFTAGAIKWAHDTGVRLITRSELKKMFYDYKVLRC